MRLWKPSRRSLIEGAAASATYESLAAKVAFIEPRRTTPSHGAMAWRGNSSHTVLPTLFSGSANWSLCTRSIHRSGVDFRRIRVALPTFIVSPPNDVDLSEGYRFQCAMEYPFYPAVSDIAPRTMFRFDRSVIAQYSPHTGPFGYLLSDILELRTTVPAGARYGLWTTIENGLGRNSPSDSIPVGTQCGTQSPSVFETAQYATTSLIRSNYASKSSAAGQLSFSSPVYTPMIFVEGDSSARCIAIFGDSIAYGIGEGNGGTGGDARGSENGNAGWPARWISETLGHGYTNLSAGSDRLQYNASPSNIRRRLALLALANPTHVLVQLGTNDTLNGTSQMQSDGKAALTNYRSRVRVPMIGATLIPASSSDIGHWTAANGSDQIPSLGNGIGSASDTWNTTYVRGLDSSYGLDGYTDASRAIEIGPIESSLWYADGTTAFLSTDDGIHPSSDGAARIAGNINGNPFT